MKPAEILRKLLDEKKLTISAFEKKVGIGNNVIGTAISRNSNLTGKTISKILNAYPELSPEWLVSGKGEMLLDNYSKKTNTSKNEIKKTKEIPLIPITALAGFGSAYYKDLLNSENIEMYKIPEFERLKPDYLIRVNGSSMVPKYNGGDIIACKIVKEMSSIIWNKPYLLDTNNFGCIVKRIHKNKNLDFFTLHSDNSNYPDFEIHKKDINHLALVVGVLRLE